MNRAIQRIVDGVPGSRSPEVGWIDPVGDLDLRLDAVLGAVTDPDEAFVRAVSQSLTARQHAVVYRYGIRLLGRGLSADDPTVLPQASVALAYACSDERDSRDLMVKLAPLHVAASRLHGEPSLTLAWVADLLPESHRARLVHWAEVPDIEDVAYGWEVVTTAEGPRFVPT